MFLKRVRQTLGLQHFEGADDATTGITRFDDIIDISTVSSLVRTCEQVFVLRLFLRNEFLLLLRIFDGLDSFRLQHTYSTAGTHHGDLCVRPCVTHITAELLTTHHDVRTAVTLTNSDSYLRYGCFAIGEHQFSTMIDDTCVLLSCSAQEARNIHEGEDLNIECIAETHETSSLTAGIAVEHAG